MDAHTVSEWLRALAGGVLIGLSASLLFVTTGRVAGVSGIFGGLVHRDFGPVPWQALFLAGLGAGGVAMLLAYPQAFASTRVLPLPLVALAGLLVGVGTRVGNGCTSGHGVCGISRFSVRSITATLTFIATGALTVLAARLIAGGAS